MNIVSSITSREALRPESKINILWSNTDYKYFTNFIQSLGHRLLSFEDLYFANYIPHLIICNDRLSSYEKSRAVSLQYHLPVIAIDHQTRNPIIVLDSIPSMNNISGVYNIAIDTNISRSWNNIHHQILSYDRTNNNIAIWNGLLYNIAKRIFTL